MELGFIKYFLGIMATIVLLVFNRKLDKATKEKFPNKGDEYVSKEAADFSDNFRSWSFYIGGFFYILWGIFEL